MIHLAQLAAVKGAAFFLVWAIAWLPLAIPIAIAVRWRPFQPLTVGQKLPLVLSLYAIAPLILWGAAQLEQRPLATYGLIWDRSLPISFGIGMGLALLGLLLLVGVQLGLGWSCWQPEQSVNWGKALLPTFLLGLWISVTEEWVFRGFLPGQLQQDYSLLWAAVSSSLIFALLHLVWDGRTAIPQLPGLWLMGMVLVLACWVNQGHLGLAIGLHAGWIGGMASLDAANILTSTEKGPVWATGSVGQPLAGILSWALLGFTAIALFGLRLG
jgi:membrane protease YdiL (CAAX protease family)